MRELNRNPAYQQLNDALRALIASGEYAVGAKFITEREIASQYGVSRATANKALSNLVSERVLEFKPGVGTFVRGSILDYDLKKLVSFSDRARASGKVPETRVVQFERTLARSMPPEASRLGLADDEPVYFVQRVRYADQKPVILERRYFAVRHSPQLQEKDLTGSLYAYWSDQCKLNITGADQVIRAVNLSAEDAAHLGTTAGSAALLVIANGFIESEEPLWFEQTLYRADAYEFYTSMGAWRTAQPAMGRFAADSLATPS